MSDDIMVFRSGVIGKTPWRQYGVVTAGNVEWLEMQPAAWDGWKAVRRWASDPDDWTGRTAEQIVAWMMDNFPQGDVQTVADELVIAQVKRTLERMKTETTT